MSKETEELVREAHENVRSDRKLLRDYADALSKVKGVAEDPLAIAGLAEPMARIADGLTRANAQLVELAKLMVKKELVKNPEGDEVSDKDGIFDEIGDGFARDRSEDEN